jgi:hypothetical protein
VGDGRVVNPEYVANDWPFHVAGHRFSRESSDHPVACYFHGEIQGTLMKKVAGLARIDAGVRLTEPILWIFVARRKRTAFGIRGVWPWVLQQHASRIRMTKHFSLAPEALVEPAQQDLPERQGIHAKNGRSRKDDAELQISLHPQVADGAEANVF